MQPEMTEHNYLVSWCLKDEGFTEGYGTYTDEYDRFVGSHAYENALKLYNKLLENDNLYTASLSLELKTTD